MGLRIDYDTEIIFKVCNYTDELKRKAVLAYDKKTGELYSDVTINIPWCDLDEENGEEAFLNSDCLMLLYAMVGADYLEIIRKVNVNYGTYRVGRFTEKFKKEFC